MELKHKHDTESPFLHGSVRVCKECLGIFDLCSKQHNEPYNHRYGDDGKTYVEVTQKFTLVEKD